MIIYWRDIGGAAYVSKGRRVYTMIKQTNGTWRVYMVAQKLPDNCVSESSKKSEMSIRSQERFGTPTIRVEYPEK